MSRSYVKREDLNGDGYDETRTTVTTDEVYYFRIRTDESGAGRAVDEVGTIALGAKSLRSAFIGETLYAIGDGQIVASAVGDPGTPLASVTWEVSPPLHTPDIYPIHWGGIVQPIGVTFTVIDLGNPPQLPHAEDNQLDAWIRAARADLAQRLGVAPDSALLVLVESPAADSASNSNGEGGPSSLKFVFRCGEQHLLYEVDAGATVELVDSNFQFSAVGIAASGEAPQPDVDGNGRVSPRDALLVIDHLLSHGGDTRVGREVLRQITPSTTQAAADVNHDGRISPRDLLLIIDMLLAPQKAAAPMTSSEADSRLEGAPAVEPHVASAIEFSRSLAPASSVSTTDLLGSQSPGEAALATPPTTVRSRQDNHDLAVAETEDWSAVDNALLSDEADAPWPLEIAANLLPRRLPD